MKDFGPKILRSLKWSYAATAIMALLQVVLTAVMARLLSPSDYGLIAIAYLVVDFGNRFARLGLGEALIQRPEINDRDIGTAYLTSIILGLFISGIVWTFAPYSAGLLGTAQATLIIRVMTLSFLLSAIGTISFNLLRRDLAFRAISLIEVSAFVVGSGIVAVSMAFLGFGVWSLVAGQLTSAALISLLATRLVMSRVSLCFDRESFKALFSFGSKLSLIGLLKFLSHNVWTVFVSHALGPRSVGLYNRASLLIHLPTHYLSDAVQRVGFPSLSQIQTEEERLRRNYFRGSLLLGAVLFPLGFSVSASAREIVLVVLGAKWTGAIDVLRIIALAAPFNMLIAVHGIVLDAKNRLDTRLIIQIFHLGIICGLYLALLPFGIVGIASAYLIVEVAFYIVYSVAVGRILGFGFTDVRHWHGAILLPTLLTACPALITAVVVPHFTGSAIITLGIEMLSSGLGYLLALTLLSTSVLRTEISKLLAVELAPRSGSATFLDRLLGRYSAYLLKKSIVSLQ